MPRHGGSRESSTYDPLDGRNTAKEVGVKVAFGTDILFDPELAERQGAFLAELQRWYGGRAPVGS